MANNWIVVGGPEIFGKTRDLGFTRHGFKSTRRNMAKAVQPGDLMAFYITGRKQFAGVVRITAPMIEENTRIWASDKKPNEMYPFRVGIEKVLILDEDQWLDAEPYHERFQWTRKWPRANWTLAYQGNLHQIPQEDMDLLMKDLKAAAKAPAASR
jgi:hypothetical protein